MSKKSSKSAAIREALKSNSGKSVAQLAKEFGVSPGLVYSVRTSITGKGRKRRRKSAGKPGPKPAAKASAPAVAHAALDSAFEFISKVGGLLHAEQVIAQLKSLKERL